MNVADGWKIKIAGLFFSYVKKVSGLATGTTNTSQRRPFSYTNIILSKHNNSKYKKGSYEWQQNISRESFKKSKLKEISLYKLSLI
jgi:hypothetical protein